MCQEKLPQEGSLPLRFCPFCGTRFNEKTKSLSKIETEEISIVSDHKLKTETVLFTIGNYQILKSIGKGGMGEVLLAYDTICGRKIALKRIRPDLLTFRQIQNRFLKEARITSQLTHPAIIPIYTIHQDERHTYYTMPFVEGKTLKQIFREARQQEKLGIKPEQLTFSIPSLIRIFLAICHAVAYAHSKSVLHRDIKPENIIVGTYGEVLILDWGLAQLLKTDNLLSPSEEDLPESPSSLHHITQIGKVVGTVSYMAPERALGQAAKKETDIYSLGVILYQILTLRLPFQRGPLKEFREQLKNEILQHPIEAAPYRDIPKELAQIALKCLSISPSERYSQVDDLIHDLENYIEGRAEWFAIAELDISKKSDWEFQELVLLAEHTAITRTAEISEWVNLMISKAPFAENIKIQFSITLQEECQGIGILFNVPESLSREQINEGYCLWISSQLTKSTMLLRNSIEVLSASESYLPANSKHQITITKLDNTISFFIDSVEQFSYISRMPLAGTHVGVLSRDNHFEMDSLKIYVGSDNIMVNCLAVPDAFLANKNFQKALAEYRRISNAFSGRAEGREAVLRSGITILEQAKSSSSPALFDAALDEFEKLHSTAGAPLEYLGKALVYEELQDIDEEIKCFELVLRRYPKHPLLHLIKEQIIFRLMESSKIDRKAAYHFLLLILCHIPDALENPAVKKLMSHLKLHWEQLEFASEKDMTTTLAFWLHKNYIIEERIEKDNPFHSLFCLMMLREESIVNRILSEFPISSYKNERKLLLPLLENNIETAFSLIPPIDSQEAKNVALALCDRALDEKRTDLLYSFVDTLDDPDDPAFTSKALWAYLQDGRFDKASKLLESIPIHDLIQENSILHYLYGCWLFATEGSEIAFIHFDCVLDVPFPRTWTLASHYISGKLDTSWFKKAFDWERWQLARQLALFEELKHSSSKR